MFRSSERFSTEDSRPLLFDADEHDNDNSQEDEGLDAARRPKTPHTVTFKEEVQVIAPSLRSTTSSRETEFDLDSDDLDDGIVHDHERAYLPSSRSSRPRQPLLVGLLDASHVQRNPDTSFPLHETNAPDSSSSEHFDLDAIAAQRTAGGNLFDSIANMANSILGAGIIGLPYATRQAGFIAGIILLVVMSYATDWTIQLIVINAKLSGGRTYLDVMNHCFGSSGRAAVSFFQFAFAFGGMCAFGIIIGDTIPQVLRSVFPNLPTTPILSLFANRQFVIAFCTICVSYPLSLYRDIHKLARASGLALVGMLIVVIAVSVEGPKVPDELKGSPDGKYTIISPGFFQAVGVISFAFVCHHNSLLIYGSLKTPTLNRFAKVTHVSTFMSLIACMTLAMAGYLVFSDKTQGNILNNFPADNVLINVARFAFGLNMFTTIPLELFVCREVIEQYFFAHETFSPQRHLFFTTVIVYSAMFVSLVTCDLGVMLEITGGVSATVLAYIFPAACYFTLVDPKLPWYSRKKLPAVVCASFGMLAMLISLYLALAKSWTVEGSAKICL